jgi:translation initiation factor IF-3
MNKIIEYNEKIKSDILRLIDNNGEFLGIFDKKICLAKADEYELDLILIAPKADPPVAKLGDFQKYKFDLNKKEKLNKKNAKIISLKQIKIGVTIDKHDLENKIKSARKFIEGGDKVSFFMRFRRKQIPLIDSGLKKLNEIANTLSDIAKIDSPAAITGVVATMVLIADPLKK